MTRDPFSGRFVRARRESIRPCCGTLTDRTSYLGVDVFDDVAVAAVIEACPRVSDAMLDRSVSTEIPG